MSNANASAPAPSVQGVTTLIGGGVVEGVAPTPAPSVEGVTTLVGVGGGVIDDYEPSQEEKSKEELEGTQAKADQKKSKKGQHKYLLSVLGRRLKKSKPFKLTWKILRGIGKPIRVVVRSVISVCHGIRNILLLIVVMIVFCFVCKFP